MDDSNQVPANRETDTNNNSIISVLVPVYNEEAVIGDFYDRLKAVLDGLSYRAEILFVNDGSTDLTLALLKGLRDNDPGIGILDFSRNFGKEIAMAAALDYAVGNAVIIIDADLQHPPELIPELIAMWQSGYDVVYTTRELRAGESYLKRVAKRIYYRVLRRISKIDIPENAGDFRLLSRRSVEAIKRLREQHRFMKGIYAWIGFPQTSITYENDLRHGGKSKWSYWNLWNLALEGITSFTTTPLYIATYIGVITALGALLYGANIIIKTLLYGNPVPGYPSLIVLILFLGGIQLITLGIIGEYLGRMFDESKNRPLYLLQEELPSAIAHTKHNQA